MNSLTLPDAPTVNQIASLLLPVSGKLLVVPNVSVAEIIPFREPDAEEDVPTWYLGEIEWRSLRVPVVSFEAINDEPFAARGANRRIAIFNAVINDDRLPFCGVVTEGLPRLMRVMADEITLDEEASAGPAERLRVLVLGERAAIPDIAFIQSQLSTLRQPL